MTQLSTSREWADEAGRLLDALRQRRPLVQNVTNYVAMDLSANALLAIGASPAMVHALEEAGDFAALADALVVNIGTLSPTFVAGMHKAAETAVARGKPWVLDPVGAGATKYRNETIAGLLDLRPGVVRGNASEIIAVARLAGFCDAAAAGKGVDSLHGTEAALAPALALARGLGCVVAATGAVDLVTDGLRVARLAHGAPIMAQVTASGCALSGVLGAFAAVSCDFYRATVAALGVYGVAGEIAAVGCAGPGSFRVALLDRLAAIDGAVLRARLKVAEEAADASLH